MEPKIHTILTIQNPGEESVVINPFGALNPETTIEKYGGQIKHGAFVTLIDRDSDTDNTVGGIILVADRSANGRLYLQNNEYLEEDNEIAADIDDIGAPVAYGDAPLDPADLETFTVYGVNDDGETFTAVVTATEEGVADAAVQAGLVDEGCEQFVKIAGILKGDQTYLEVSAS